MLGHGCTLPSFSIISNCSSGAEQNLVAQVVVLLAGCVHVVVLEGNGGAHWVVVVIHAIVASDGRVKSLPRDILLDYRETGC